MTDDDEAADFVAIDLEQGGMLDMLEGADYFQDFYETIVISFPDVPYITKSMLYTGIIEAIEVDLYAQSRTLFCWMPKEHKLATLLLFNRGYFENCEILESSLFGLHVIGCEREFIDAIVDYVWEKFTEQGFEMIKKEDEKESGDNE